MPQEYEDEDYENQEGEQEEEVEEQPEEEEETAEEPEEEGEAEAETAEEGEDENDWAYSTCSGTKKAVFVGINYAGSAAPLNGCHNDVENLNTFISEQWGYEDAEKRILIDDDEDPETQPTRENMIAAFKWLVEGASPNDALFLHYSGHGGTEVDTDGDEHDGTDETLCPIDYEENGQIVDDELHEILIKPLPKGCRLTVVFDCCHSGTSLDLPYTYGADGEIDTKTSKDHGKFATEEAVKAQEEGDMNALALAARQMALVAAGGTEAANEKTKKTKTSHADVVYLSGCRDIQYSADAQEDGKNTGALSHCLVSSLTENHEQSYHELLVDVRKRLVEGGYTQVPQLSSSHPIDTSLQFII